MEEWKGGRVEGWSSRVVEYWSSGWALISMKLNPWGSIQESESTANFE